MKVILKVDVEGVGSAGDIVEVSPGYARNYLIPRGLALAATSRNVKSLEKQKAEIMKKVDKERKRIEALAQRLAQTKVVVTKQAGEKGRLFGSVTTRDIADALAREGIEIDRKKIVLEETIKTLGSYQVKVKLPHGIESQVQVEVTEA
ncbi:MAG TPA: 50S ribosomal protein L9 [Thermosulfidibacter takaii]|uniref:Large ribosomal subunit protein bL9 n=1 Tax=Thermosulfidibacter takaii TaxID=412593 RepID=A0A7C0Y8C3_9BACT|nr:50S ribosomal protein L9 [Thermosulfidibacter takaii]